MRNNQLQLLVRAISVLIILLCNTSVKAQDSVRAGKNIYYLTIGGGNGSGFPLQETNGISGMLELGLQKDKVIYGLGVRGVGEIDIFSDVNNSMMSIDLTYGRVYKTRRLFSSISAGLGYVTAVTKGEFISSDGWFATHYYEKYTNHTIGFPISAKAFWLPSTYIGFGAEVFANLNNLNSFYGVNFSIQFEKMPPRKKRDK